MKINYNTLRRRVDSAYLLTMKDIVALAELFEVSPTEIFNLAIADIKKTSKSKRN